MRHANPLSISASAPGVSEIPQDRHETIDDADGFMASVDVRLLLLEKVLGDSVRAETARFILFSGLAACGARYFASFAPEQAHGDKAVLKAQKWVHIRDGRDVSLAAMAAASGLGRRTFLRRFANATGMTPIKYCRAVRMARARELLQSGNTPQKEIAYSLGYEDVASFSRVFRKATGLAPGAYRKTFRGGMSRETFVQKVLARRNLASADAAVASVVTAAPRRAAGH